MTTPDGRVVKLPDGATEQQMRAIFAKFRNGEQPTPAERALLQKMRQMNGGPGGSDGRPRADNFQFGGNYIVFVKTPEGPKAVPVKTGLTDLDHAEVVSGLAEGDSVLVLPSASLVQSQAEMKNRIRSMTGGGVPGMQQQQRPAANAPAAGGR
jgi:hypothetical protein